MSERSSSHILATIFTSVLTSAVITVGILYLSGNLPIPGQSTAPAVTEAAVPPEASHIATPALIGLTTKIAADVLTARKLRLVVQEERPNNDVPQGHICAQDPLADSMLPTDSAVSVVVSTGPDLVPMLDVTNKPIEEAKKLLTDAGFAIGKIIESATGAPGNVVKTEPDKNEMVPSGSTVNITYTNAITVPKVVGMPISKGKKILTDAGFKIGKLRRGFSDYMNYNAIISQDPAADAVAAPQTEINLVINND